MTAVTGGRPGVRRMVHRLLNWRVGARWYLAAPLTAAGLTWATRRWLSFDG